MKLSVSWNILSQPKKIKLLGIASNPINSIYNQGA